ncbi:indolepyruvate oxidoreductase [bacterium]|nr:indolepyruvate oxidoreductase [candidate division CSSED10-310 bacterium]
MNGDRQVKPLPKREMLLGNVAIAWGLVKHGCQIAASYPGTPSSEILGAVAAYATYLEIPLYTEWSLNEKIALELALAAAYTGKRAACAMKQVGLNVAADPLMSAAYTGVSGGLLIIVADDPGPHSSQTEQDTRMFARFAKVPVLDPASPAEAVDMIAHGFELSEKHQVPVILRPSLRVCHAKQSITYGPLQRHDRLAVFEKEPSRWAATPRDRYRLHKQLNDKLDAIAAENGRFNYEIAGSGDRAIIACGVEYAGVRDFLREAGLDGAVPILKIGMPSPMAGEILDAFIARHEAVLVLEDPDSAVEEQATQRARLRGRMDGTVPRAGELTAEVIHDLLRSFLGLPATPDQAIHTLVEGMQPPVRKPTLCAGCPHRASFWTIRRTFPRGIYPSDIGCYTLGKNLHAVDTCLDMGAAINIATGMYRSYRQDGVDKPVIATIGDSTFFHSGLTGLANAVYDGSRYIVVILDNGTVAMTGMQPAPTTGIQADGSMGNRLSIEDAVRGVGVNFLEVVDSYDVASLRTLLERARDHTLAPDGGMAVIISRHPCLLNDRTPVDRSLQLVVGEECNACGYCLDNFECPAITLPQGADRVVIDHALCARCGVCVNICVRKALRLEKVTE